jgi:hypothetical protein
MTDEQREQARRAQAVYVAWLREWENFIRNREAYRQRENHVTENGDGEITSICPFTNADIEKAVTICGDFLQAENEAYQTFSKFFIGKPDVLKGFDELRDTVRKAYALSDQGLVPDKLADALKNLAEAVEVFDFGIMPDLLKDLAPESNRADAIQYCARLVCHVWNTGEHGGKRKSADHVFVKAKGGESLFCDCKYARTLVEKWGISVGGIMTVAAKIHAEQSGGKHIKADGMERPETMRQAAKKSRAKEQAEERAERKR